MNIAKRQWGVLNAEPVWLYTISNGNMEISVSTFGSTLTSLNLFTTKGHAIPIVLGYSRLDDYVSDPYYMGSTIGRFANRIQDGEIETEEGVYRLGINEEGNHNHLHGGYSGFNKKNFKVTDEKAGSEEASVRFRYVSPHLEEGYPGRLDLTVEYLITAKNSLIIRYRATTDRATIVSITNHAYYNLAGGKGFSADHQLSISADRYLEMNARFLPTGKILPIAGAHDFRQRRKIGTSEELPNGYNNYYIFKNGSQSPQISLQNESTSVTMEMDTSFPGVMLYTGDYLSSPFGPQKGLCLEAQDYPDSPHHVNFPTSVLYPGHNYEREIRLRFNWQR